MVRGVRIPKPINITAEKEEYVFKLIDSFDGKHEDFVPAENEVILFLRERNVPCPLVYPIAGDTALKLNVHVSCSEDLTKEACNVKLEEDNGDISTTEKCIMRLISFLLGVTAAESGEFSSKKLFSIRQLRKTLQVCIILEQLIEGHLGPEYVN